MVFFVDRYRGLHRHAELSPQHQHECIGRPGMVDSNSHESLQQLDNMCTQTVQKTVQKTVHMTDIGSQYHIAHACQQLMSENDKQSAT